jgi:aminoglycoside phosphotransferase (APT) family kinase protein
MAEGPAGKAATVTDTETPDTALEATVVSWLERHVGAVRSITRQGRWRPAWYAEVDANGERLSLYIRGDRGGRWPPMPLAYEAKVHQVFADCGVRVPKLYGYIQEIPALVMERVRGKPNIATAKDDATRDRLREQLVDQMRKIHEIDPKLIVAAGSPDPKDPREITLSHYRQAERLYLTGDRLPSPDIEFVRGWLNRNAPPCEEGPSVIAMDAGQFIFEGDELTAMLDFEFVVVGDRHVDFAALRTRDSFEQIGDLELFYQLYEKRGGRPIDRRLAQFHHIPFIMYATLEVAEELARPLQAADHYEYFRWHAHGLQTAIEDIARYTSVELPPYVPPEPRHSRYALGLQGLAAAAEQMTSGDEYSAYRNEKFGTAARYFAIREAWSRDFERELLADVHELTGERPADEWEADLVLERFVQTAQPEHDAKLLQLLHRRARRLMLPVEQAGGRKAGAGPI